MELVHLERQAVDTAATAGALAGADAVRQALGAQLAALTGRRARRGPLLAALEHRLALATRALEDVSTAEKQVRVY